MKLARLVSILIAGTAAWTADPADDLLTTGLRWAVEDE